MRLNPVAFNRHLDHMGQSFKWRKAYTCPCRNPHSGAALDGCPRCFGVGTFWGPAVDAKAGVANQTVTKQFAQFGQWELGDAVFSIQENSPMYDAARYDRLLMLNSTDGFSLPLVRGANDRVDMPVQKVDSVFWLDADGLTIVEGGIPTVGVGGVLTWASGEPPEGQQYSISGTRFTEYFVFEKLPSDRGEHYGARLPRRLLARRFDLFNRQGQV